MDTWNRDQLYVEVWEQPASKVAVKHGVSGVMIGKVCRRLKIPLPGRGYWAKEEFGKPVQEWANEKHDLPPDAPKDKRIAWMKEQADRMDPMVESPNSILDRKRELSHW